MFERSTQFSRMISLLVLVLWSCSGSSSTISSDTWCMIIDLEYINCTWGGGLVEGGAPQENYTFRSRFEERAERDCQAYLKVSDVNMGCIVPYNESNGERFRPLLARLYRADGSVAVEQQQKLNKNVKLNPAYNLTVKTSDTELWLYWNFTRRIKPDCAESEVRYRTDGKDWLQTHPISAGRNTFTLAFPNAGSVYEFQVRVRMCTSCGMSKIWSIWSQSVFHSTPKNDTVTPSSLSVPLMVLYTTSAAVVLLTLSCLLIHSERLRVILVPVVPNAGKNFADLIENYDGNVEKWMNISKELQDGFKPNFSERPCPVREYQRVPQSSSSSGLSDVSTDYQPMHSYSSASTLSATASTTQTPPTTPSML